jgi:hypothetical protein
MLDVTTVRGPSLTQKIIMRVMDYRAWYQSGACQKQETLCAIMNHNCGTLIMTAWHILGLCMEKTASRYVSMLNKQLQRAQAVSRRLPTAPVWVRAQVRSCGGQSGTGACFHRVLRFPLSILILPNAPYSSIIRGWYNRSISGRRTKWTVSPHPKN